ncbi:MAG: 4Fe-4S binding protein, partial [Clostridia bacterium]
MSEFDTKVQWLKYQVVREVIKRTYSENMNDAYIDIPKLISPGPKANMRCCIYKERVILQERIKLATGGNADKPSVIEVIDEACDECPIGGIFVTPACRGCISHACKNHCPKNAIKIIDHKATVDQSLCVECEQCVKACPYGAIIHQHRPCVSGCKVKAITVGEDKKATIDYNKCIACGNCVYQCPFGAVSDKSMILQVVDMVRGSDNGRNYNMYAIVAPSL